MPSKNIIKEFIPDSYYHVYNRGVNKQLIFLDEYDKQKLIFILSRHFGDSGLTKIDGTFFRKFDNEIEIQAYCLMGNHFHFLFYLGSDEKAISELMRSILTAYTMYFNKRHHRVGPLFQSIYKSSRITNEEYLLHISRYIHLNPRNYLQYHYSSLAYYLGAVPPIWLNPTRILSHFQGYDYLDFVEDYIDHAKYLDEVKHELADTS